MNRGVMPQWPEEVTVVVPDDALEPHVKKGDFLTFEACDTADPKKVVVLELADGSRWIRRLVVKPNGELWGATTSDAFPEFRADGPNKIVACATRKASPFSGF